MISTNIPISEKINMCSITTNISSVTNSYMTSHYSSNYHDILIFLLVQVIYKYTRNHFRNLCKLRFF